MNRFGQWVTLIILVLGVVLIGASVVLNPAPKLLYNPSDSAPLGWYRIEPQSTYKRGDLVAVWLPDEVETHAAMRGYLPPDIPVIKTTGAVAGDTICRTGSTVSFPEQPLLLVYQEDGQGRRMLNSWDGCIELKEGEIALLSIWSERSFDSRYFGPVGEDLVIGRARFLGNAEETDDGEVGQKGGARGWGAQGKIKGRSAAAGLTPCLHIFFYSAANLGEALMLLENCNSNYTAHWRYFIGRHTGSQSGEP